MKWQDISVDIKTLSPGGCLPLLMNIYCIKSDFKEIFWNLQMKWQDVPVDIKILSPRGCQPLPWGYIHV